MKTFHPRQNPSNAKIFTSLLISFAFLMTPVMQVAAASARVAGLASGAAFPRAFNPAATVVSATKTDSFPDPDGDGKAEPGQTITYDVNVSNTGAADATGVSFSDTIDANTTLVPGSLRVSPLAFADSYTATINTQLNITAPGVLGNDTGTPAPTAVPIAGGPTSAGGTVTLNANGSFTYNPPNATFQGADTFTYTATNGTTPNDSATVTINVDAGPAVTTTSPANGANNVAPTSNITVNFTEPVNATTGSFSVQCPAGSPQTFTLSASPSASFTLDPTADLPAGVNCTVTVFAAGITDADNFDPPDNMAADYTFSFGVKPLAVDDMRSATGNVKIDTSITGYSVLANDQGPGAAITAFDATSANGGQVVMNTSTGTFTYNPPRGFTGTDTFNYTLSNAGGSDTGTVVLTVTDTVWFINNAAGACSSACDGRLTNPYTSIAAFVADNGDGGANPAAGDSIFIHTGGGNYTGPLTLADDQIVVGQGAASGFTALTLITPAPDSAGFPSTGGASPVITTTVTSGQPGVALAQNNHIHGLSFSNTDGAAVLGSSDVGAFTMSEIVVNNTNGAPGIAFTGGGEVTSTGVNTISTASGTALDVTNTNIGSLGLTFRSISAGTAVGTAGVGINLKNTGTAASNGGLIVTGNSSGQCGGSVVINNSGAGTESITAANSADCTGGQIRNKTGADGSTTSGIGIYLENTKDVSLTRMWLHDFQNFGVRGFRVNGFSLNSVLVNGANGTSPSFDNYGEGSVHFGDDASAATNGLTGSASVTNSSVSGGRSNNFAVINTAGTLDRLTITGSNFGLTQNFADSNDSLLIESRDLDPGAPVVKATVTSSRFTGAAGDLAQFVNQSGTGTMDVVFQNNNLSDNHAQNIIGGGGLSLNTNASMTLNVSDNHLRDANGSAVTLQKGNAGTSLNGTLDHNRIGVSGVANSGSVTGNGLFLVFAGGGTITLAVTDNDIRQYAGNAGIYDDNTDGTYDVNLTVTNNVLAEPGGGVFAGLVLTAGAPGSPDDIDVCATITGNDFSTADPNNFGDVFIGVSGSASSINLPGYAGTTVAQVATFIQNNNLNSATTDVFAYDDNGDGSTAPSFTGNAGCTQPIAQVNDSFSTNAPAVEVASSTTTAAPAREWSDMTAPSASPAANAANDKVAFVNASYEPPVKRTAKADKRATKSAKAAARAATLAPQPFSGETVNASVGTLPAGKSVHITFQVTVDNPFPTGASQVANQGTISGDNFPTVLTDDPAAGGSADPTVTQILTPPDVSIKDASVAEPASGSAPAAFAVTLSHAYTHTVTVNYATAPDTGGANPATAGSDYTATSGTLTFNPGEIVQTVSVDVLADGDASETNETFLVNISGATGGAAIADSQAVGTITPNGTPGTVMISELRTSGPSGADDEFVELYNNTDSPVTVAASDASGGWAIVKSGGGCNATPVVVAVIPNGTVIPARGNYLVVGSAYSLGSYAAGDQSLVLDIENDRNVALFNTADLSNVSTGTRLDAVGFGANTGGNCDLLREGATLADAQGSTAEYSFVRKVDKGSTQDANVNADDFIVVSTTSGAVGANAVPTLGAPGPENSTGARGPVPCDVTDTARFGRSRLDSTVALGSAPNTVRDATVGPNAANGTIDFRRRFTNNTGGAVTRLRFRITNMKDTSTPGTADLRALSSSAIVVGGVNDTVTCGGSAPCSVNVVGTTLEQPPTQASGGGVNSSLGVGTITLGTPLASGASVNLHLLFGVQQTGDYHVSIVIETATAGSIGQDEWELRGNTETGGHTEGGCNTPPVANAGADQTIECGGASTPVTLDGSASSDADGDTLTYEWREGATVLGTGVILNTNLPFGPHTVTLKVTDPSGDFSEDTVSVNIVDTTDPMITAPPNVSVNTGPGASSCGAFVSDATLGNATASDGCSASVTVTRTGVPAGNNFPVGTTIITYTADDGHGHTANAFQSVTVIDNTPPTLSVPANINVNAPPNSCSVNVNPGTATANDNCPGVTVTGTRSDSQPLNAPYPVGTTTITWKATDAHGNITTGTQTVKVNDVTPPTIVLTSGAIILGPPNHQYATLSIANIVASVTDSCDASVDINDVVISQATSDEEEDAAGGGDGNTNNDIVIAPDCKSLQLRAERQGGGDGRVYKITVKVKDSSGNVATAVRTVIVPKTGSSATDSGVRYTVNGCLP